jgi:rubrerythrin
VSGAKDEQGRCRQPPRREASLQLAPAPAATPDAPGAVPRTVDEFMALALAMEAAAADRYAELADTMQAHNNSDTAALFRRMAAIEIGHAREIQARIASAGAAAGAPAAPVMPGAGAAAPAAVAPAAAAPAAAAEDGLAAAESASPEALHYLMLPWHALQIALANERRAERFFADLARAATSDDVREAALRLCAEEREHVALIEAWLARTPRPPDDWWQDPDPPRYAE